MPGAKPSMRPRHEPRAAAEARAREKRTPRAASRARFPWRPASPVKRGALGVGGAWLLPGDHGKSVVAGPRRPPPHSPPADYFRSRLDHLLFPATPLAPRPSEIWRHGSPRVQTRNPVRRPPLPPRRSGPPPASAQPGADELFGRCDRPSRFSPYIPVAQGSPVRSRGDLPAMRVDTRARAVTPVPRRWHAPEWQPICPLPQAARRQRSVVALGAHDLLRWTASRRHGRARSTRSHSMRALAQAHVLRSRPAPLRSAVAQEIQQGLAHLFGPLLLHPVAAVG